MFQRTINIISIIIVFVLTIQRWKYEMFYDFDPTPVYIILEYIKYIITIVVRIIYYTLYNNTNSVWWAPTPPHRALVRDDSSSRYLSQGRVCGELIGWYKGWGMFLAGIWRKCCDIYYYMTATDKRNAIAFASIVVRRRTRISDAVASSRTRGTVHI
jgi:hypothetical protein